MKEMLQKLLYIMSAKEKRQIGGLLFMMLVGGFLELAGVSVVLPLINQIIGADNASIKPILMLSVLLILVYVVKNVFLAWMYRSIFSFVFSGMSALSTRMLAVYMKEPYSFHLSRNIAVLQRTIRQDVEGCYRVIKPLLQIIAESVICATLMIYLLVTNPMITIFLALLLGVCVGIFLMISKKTVKRLGQEDIGYQAKMNQWVLQAISGIKEIKILGREPFFVESYQGYSRKSAKNNERQQFLVQLPRMVTETVCMAGVLLLIIAKALSGENLATLIPKLAVFAIAAFRLLPSVGKINGFLAELLYFRPTVDCVYDDLKELEKLEGNSEQAADTKEDMPELQLKKELCTEQLDFHYDINGEKILSDVSIQIPIGKAVALIGPSGAGKTTLADLLMGLLVPTRGEIMVDGQSIQKNLPSWYRQIGYVPQTIYLSDDSIRNNVAFGIPADQIKDELVWKALKQARLDGFVEGLKEGLDTLAGDRGIRLSGGQRQRIGIARALYHNPQILIFDEATSALDNETEQAVMEAIEQLHGSKTMIIIAHRLSTIENCDITYVVKDGKVTLA